MKSEEEIKTKLYFSHTGYKETIGEEKMPKRQYKEHEIWSSVGNLTHFQVGRVGKKT